MKFRKLFFSTFIILLTFTVGTSYGSRVSTLPQPGVKTLAGHLTDIDNNFKELYRLIFAAESGYTGLGAGIITSGVLSDARIPDGITRDTELTSGLASKQNASVNLTTFAGIAPAANVISILTAADYPAIKALLDLEVGTDFYSISTVDSLLSNKQTLNTHLTDLTDGSLTGSKVGTGISATNVTTGTLPDAVIPSTITRDTELTTALGSYTTTSALTTLLAGKMNTATGTPDGTKFLRDDLTWQIVSGGGGVNYDINTDGFIDDGFIPSGITRDSELSTTLSNYVLSSVLSDYVTTATLSTNLNNYISSSALTTILSDYIQTGDSVSLGSITSTGSITSSGGADGQIGIWWSNNNTIAPTITESNGIYPGSDGIYVRWNGSNSLIGAGGSGSVYVDGSIVNNPNLDSNGTVDVSVSGSNISSNVKANSLTLNNLTTGSVITSSESVLNEDTSVMTSGAVVKYINDTVNHLVNTKLSDAGFTIANYINPVSSPVEVTEASYTVSGNVYDNGTTPTVEVSLNSGSYTSADVTGTTSPWGWSELLTLISGSNTIDVRVTNSDLEIVQLPQVNITYTPIQVNPTLVSLTIPPAGTTAEAVFSKAMAIGVGGAGGWTLNDPTVAMTWTGGTGTIEDPVIFSLARTVLSTATENPYASYTQPTNGFESVDDGVDLASIPNASVTNNSTQTSGVACTGDFSSGDNESFESAEDAFCTTGWAVSDISGAISTYDTSFYNTGTHGASIICDADTEANNNRIYADLGAFINTGLYIRYYVKFDNNLPVSTASGFLQIGDDNNEKGGAAYQTVNNIGGVFYTYIRTGAVNTAERFAITPGNKYRVEIYIVKYGASIMRLYDDTGVAVVTTNGSGDTEVEITSGNTDIQYVVFRDESSTPVATTIGIDDIKISTTGWIGE